MIGNIDGDALENNADIVCFVKIALYPFQTRIRKKGYAG
jgi:hypothetical protein